MLLVDDFINPCSFNLAVLHFVRPGRSFHHPYVHPDRRAFGSYYLRE